MSQTSDPFRSVNQDDFYITQHHLCPLARLCRPTGQTLPGHVPLVLQVDTKHLREGAMHMHMRYNFWVAPPEA